MLFTVPEDSTGPLRPIVRNAWHDDTHGEGARRSGLPDHRHRWNPVCRRPTDLVKPVPVDATGLSGPTRRRRPAPGGDERLQVCYVPIDADSDVVEQRILEQGCRVASYGAVTGWAALRWRGASFFDGTEVSGRRCRYRWCVGLAKIREDDRIQLSQAQLAPTERTSCGGIWVATVQRALFDVMRWCDNVRDAVVCMDMAAAAGLISVRLMSRYVELRPAWTGVPLVREALALAIDDRRSPPGTRMGLIWELDALLPRPVFNQPLFFTWTERCWDTPICSTSRREWWASTTARITAQRATSHGRASVSSAYRDHGLEYFTVVGGDISDLGRTWSVACTRRARERGSCLRVNVGGR